MSGVRLLDYWSPPDGAGRPIACLATTFTFEADFFTQDCLSRFLSLSTVAGEGDGVSSIAAVLEEEERLNETQVTVLVDRSTPAEKRNLRWDLLPVGIPGGLLHAKVAVLVWEQVARIIIGSANLTSAGYRRQIEIGLALELADNSRIPKPVADGVVDELRRFVDLVPGPVEGGAKSRAMATLDLVANRASALDLPSSTAGDLRLAVATARPGVSPLDRLAEVWRGSQPLSATVLSPFWDDVAPAPAVESVRKLLTGRPASSRWTTLVASVDPFTGIVQAPASLASHTDTHVAAFDPPDEEPRSLHAKLVLVESEEWVAALVGSSNATTAGFGLDRHYGHHELNLWIGCRADSRTGRQIKALACAGNELTLNEQRWEPSPDEDEPMTPALPLGFVRCTIESGPPIHVLMEFDRNRLPDVWQVKGPEGRELLSSEDWHAADSPTSATAPLSEDALPAFLLVRWEANGESYQATWTANVEDRAILPPPAELADLPVNVLLAALASTRPLPIALEHELQRRERTRQDGERIDLDPLRRFDDSGLLLRRARHLSLALWRLHERLSRPTTSFDAIHWRLMGPLGPLAIADGLVRAAAEDETVPGEAHFLLAELALTVARVDWDRAATDLADGRVRTLVAHVLDELEERRKTLPPPHDDGLDSYVREALEVARR